MNTSRLVALLLTIMLCTSAGPLPGAAPCPVVTGPYGVDLEPPEITAVTGNPVFVAVRLDPSKPPAGSTVSTLVEVIQGPPGAKPDIVPGFPRIRMTFPEPGTYFLEVTVTLITKPSCGGVEAEEISRSMLKALVSRP